MSTIIPLAAVLILSIALLIWDHLPGPKAKRLAEEKEAKERSEAREKARDERIASAKLYLQGLETEAVKIEAEIVEALDAGREGKAWALKRALANNEDRRKRMYSAILDIRLEGEVDRMLEEHRSEE